MGEEIIQGSSAFSVPLADVWQTYINPHDKSLAEEGRPRAARGVRDGCAPPHESRGEALSGGARPADVSA